MIKFFFGFGTTIQNGLITEAKKQNLPKNFKFPYYSLVQKSVIDFVGETGGERILNEINAELSRKTGISGSTGEILAELSKLEILKSIQNFSGHEHVIYLWSNEGFRDKILTHYFESSQSPKRVFSSKKFPISDVSTTTYREIFSDKKKSIDKTFQSIIKTHEENNLMNPTLIAGLDGTRWFDKGLTKEFFEVENSAQQYIEENFISGICAYDVKKFPDKLVLKKFLSCHNTVLLDNPCVIYERGN